MKYKAILFDLDGTLLDSLDDLHNSVNHTLAAFGFPLKTREDTRLAVGNGVGMLITRSIPDGQNNPRFSECLAFFRKHYAANSRILTRPYDGILELLTALHSKGIRIGVVSNKFDSAVKALCQEYFGDLIDIAVGERQGIRRKPFPDSLFAAMDALSVTPDTCFYVGDSETDVESAQNASIPCLSALWGFRDKETLVAAGASLLIEKPSQVLDFLEHT